MKAIVLASLAAITASAGGAHIRFEPYSGNQPVERGQGGAKVTENGIDYWTSGAPVRPFQIPGVLHFYHDTGFLGDKVVGSKTIAEQAKGFGGSAVVLGASRSAPHRNDRSHFGSSGRYGATGSNNDARQETLVVVLRYL